MKKTLLVLFAFFLMISASKATVHIVQVWDGYFQFLEPASPFVVELGDTIQWVPLDQPVMIHTVTSTDIPDGAMAFDYIWQAPADTFFQYVPTVIGSYDYECTPHAQSFDMIGKFTVIEGTTSAADLQFAKPEVRLFPNPAADVLSIDLKGGPTGDYTVQLMDHSGRQLNVLFHGAIHSENRTIISSVAHLPSGIYYVLLEGDGYRRAQRWVKQ